MGAEKMYDFGWSDEKKCQGCGHGEAQVVPLSNLAGSERPAPGGISKTSKEDCKWQRSNTSYPLSGGNYWKKSHVSDRKWESEKHRSWSMTVGSFYLRNLFTQVMSPRFASTSAVSTRRSSTPRGETNSTSRMTLPPQSQPPRTPTVFIGKRQPAVPRSPYQQVW